MKSQNGWEGLHSDSPLLYTWVIPAKNGESRFRLRNGSAGFLLAYWLLWYSEVVEPLAGKILDDWGHAWRDVRGYSVLSNHASGTAADMNATRHPLGRRGTFSKLQYLRLRARLLLFRGTLRLGIDYANRADEMHVEVNAPMPACEAAAQRLMNTPRGKRVLAANPSQKRVILS